MDCSPDCLRRLTGRMVKQLEVYVEDDLAEYIARQVVRDKGLSHILLSYVLEPLKMLLLLQLDATFKKTIHTTNYL